MLTKLHFKYRGYKKMCLISVKSRIMNWIKTLLLCIKSVYQVIKVDNDNLSRWERYVIIKKIENNNGRLKERQEIAELYINYIGEVFKFARYLIIYCSYKEVSIVPKDDYQRLQDEFNVTKKIIKNLIRELEKRNIAIPSEFKIIIESTNVYSFDNLRECQKFYQKLKSHIEEILKTNFIDFL